MSRGYHLITLSENCLYEHCTYYTSTAVYAFPFARPMIVPILLYLQHTSQDAIVHRT